MIISIILPAEIRNPGSLGLENFAATIKDSCRDIDSQVEVVQTGPGRLPEQCTGGKGVLICSGSSCPETFEQVAKGLGKCIIIAENPEFRESIKNKLSQIDTPVLLLSSANKPWDFRKGSISYHDLISGSLLINVRSSQSHPLFMLNTQAFNGAVTFIHENLG